MILNQIRKDDKANALDSGLNKNQNLLMYKKGLKGELFTISKKALVFE